MSYRFLEHTADIKIEVKTKNLESAFLDSANALRELIAEKIAVKNKISRRIKVEGKDKEQLLYNFLEEILYFLDAEDFLLSDIKKLEISKVKDKQSYLLKAEAVGDKASNYEFSNNVKAITYNQMSIKDKPGRVIIRFVLDV